MDVVLKKNLERERTKVAQLMTTVSATFGNNEEELERIGDRSVGGRKFKVRRVADDDEIAAS
jgi:hypothetical protein